MKVAQRAGWTGRMAALLLACCCGAAASSVVFAAASAAGFQDPASTAALVSDSAARSPLLAVALAGKRAVAVGLRGLVVYSDDDGKTWTQASVPVQVDLTAVTFPTPTHGWAVGHRGVVIESLDAGATWTRHFTGEQLNELAVKYYSAQHPEPKTPAAQALSDVQQALDGKLPPSLLDIWFDSPISGTFVGTFNTIYRTSDGGATWTPWMDRTENPDGLHFYSVRGDAQGLYLAGEKGSVWKLDDARRQWVAMPTGFAGTLFGLIVHGADVLAYGMRGSVFTSDNSGHTWQQVTTPRKAGFSTGLRLADGSIVLADQTGELLRSADAGRSFAAFDSKQRLFSFSLAQAADGRVFSAGPDGVRVVAVH